MRDKETMHLFDAACRLQQWMYASEENTITCGHGTDMKFRLSMDENGTILVSRVILPGRGWTRPSIYGSQADPGFWREVIDDLKTQPPVQANTQFGSRFDEIMFYAAVVRTLNPKN